MRTLVHLSDLHFGRVDAALLGPLIDVVAQVAPDVVVVSGDLTQRARTAEFKQAREFLERLSGPRIVVPGNHDVPLYNVMDRFSRPLQKFRAYIESEPTPAYIDDEIAVLGINTSRSLTIKSGRINAAQLEYLRETMRRLDAGVVKVVVTHHPFDVCAGDTKHHVVRRAARAMAVFADCGADVLLAGHLHMSYSGDSQAHYPLADYAALVVSAGTATSTRGRGETNSFNVLKIRNPRIALERFDWFPEAKTFKASSHQVFERAGNRWVIASRPHRDPEAPTT
ncbi:MAG TPA: metallophosphoesterase family protein [Burkholderiales bacterium]|nr:metallophosphoesterase family protein [Burkholderiales bacterium]